MQWINCEQSHYRVKIPCDPKLRYFIVVVWVHFFEDTIPLSSEWRDNAIDDLIVPSFVRNYRSEFQTFFGKRFSTASFFFLFDPCSFKFRIIIQVVFTGFWIDIMSKYIYTFLCTNLTLTDLVHFGEFSPFFMRMVGRRREQENEMRSTSS